MKLKGISFIEQHIEKFLLLGAAVIALFFAALQFLGPGRTVELSRDTSVSAAEVDDAIANMANDIRARLGEGMAATVTPPASPDVSAWFESQLTRPLGPSDRMFATAPYTRPFIQGAEATDTDDPYFIPTFVAASKPFIGQYADAIDSEAFAALPDAYKNDLVFSTNGTTDISFVTPAFMLDLEAIRAAYAADDPSGETITIPSRWYDDRIYVLWVTLERQELLESGQWSEAEEVEPFPAFTSHRNYVNDDPVFTITGMENVKAWLREEPGRNQAAIIQPEFLPTKGLSWAPPEPPREDEADPIMQQALDLQAEVDSIESRLALVVDELTELGGPLDDAGRRGSGGGGDAPEIPGGGGRGGGGGPDIPGGGGSGGDIGGQGSGSGSGGMTDDERKEKAQEGRRRILTREMKGLEARLGPLQKRLDEFIALHGLDLNPTPEHVIPDLDALDEVLVWSHDPFVVPGKTYRYRATVRVYNPLFGKHAFLQPEQKHYADQAALNVQPTEWSDPVSIEGHTRFFVTKATADDGLLDMGVATVEVFRLYDGVWYRREWDVFPGDAVGEMVRLQDANGNPMQVSFDTNAYIQDILRIPADDVRAGATRTIAGRVVIVRGDGAIEVRDPASDEASRQRHRLLGFAQESERHARGE